MLDPLGPVPRMLPGRGAAPGEPARGPLHSCRVRRMSKLSVDPHLLRSHVVGTLAGAAVMAIIGACSADPEPAPTLPDAGGPPDASDGCFRGASIDPLLWPKECEYEFCPPETFSADIVTPAGVSLPCRTSAGQPCAQQTDEGSFGYRYNTDDVELVVYFSPELGSDFTEAGLREHFSAVEIRRLAVGEPPAADLAFDFRGDFDELAQLEGFRFADGRLTATIRFDMETISYNLEDVDPQCLEGDLILPCVCEFTGFQVPSVLTLDLALAPIPLPPARSARSVAR